MDQLHDAFLRKADAAMARGDYLNAIRLALRAASAPENLQGIRCDAYLTLAQASLALEMPEEALSFAVGAHLSACWARDAEREDRASSLVALVMAEHPNLGDEPIASTQH